LYFESSGPSDPCNTTVKSLGCVENFFTGWEYEVIQLPLDVLIFYLCRAPRPILQMKASILTLTMDSVVMRYIVKHSNVRMSALKYMKIK